MSLSTNPIYKLGKDVLEGRMPQEEALRIADSIFFKNRVNADHIYEIILHVDSLINVNHTTESYLYVLITKTSFDNDTISYELAVCNRFLALIQIQQHGYNDALDLLRANLSFYISHHQYAFQLADCYTLMGNAYMGLEDANNAIESYNDAHDILSSLQMPNEIACCLQMKGTAFEAKFLFDEALESYENALKTFTQNGYAEGVANCNLSIANLYRAHQQYNHVPERYYAARKIFEELNRPIGIAKCNFNESIYYYKIGQIEKALELLSSAQEYFEDSGDDVSAAYCYIHLAVICQITDENAPEYKRSLNDALFCLSRASEIFFKHDMIFQVGECAYNAGNTFCRLHDYDHALKEFQKAKSIYDSLHNTVNALSCQIGIGNIYEDQGQYQNALACFSKVIEYEILPPEIKWEFL
ncbi:MAG: tetratricopeptide repeat protein, partial [Prolixibacteraceae bacterium]|nr:tetratricopeptide repeat protein [Prolixibacteraceae bacterium]